MTDLQCFELTDEINNSKGKIIAIKETCIHKPWFDFSIFLFLYSQDRALSAV